MSKKVILTGVTGQAASYFADYLLENTDYEIHGMVRRLSVKNHKNIEHLKDNPRFHIFSGDLNDGHSIYENVKRIKPDYFINAAAQSFVAESWISPANTMQVDAVAIIYILEAIRTLVPNCRFVNFGSSEEMGDVQYSPQDEKHPPRARSVYGAAKIAARQIIKVYRESYNLYAIQPWCFNYESPRRGEEFVTRKITKGVARIYHAIKNGQSFEPIELGNLDSKRDWSYCLDFIDGIWKMLNQQQELNHIAKDGRMIRGFNIGWQPKEYVFSSGETHSIREFIEISFKNAGIEIEDCNPERIAPTQENPHLGRQINYQNKDGRPVVIVSRKFYRPADVEILHGDSSLARKELNWQPKTSFNELVSMMVKSDIENFSS